MFGTYIGRCGCEAYLSKNRCHVDNGTSAFIEHRIDLMLHTEEHAGEVNRNRPAPTLVRHLPDKACFATDPSIITCKVKLTVFGYRFFHKLPAIVGLGNIGMHIDCLTAGPLDCI